MKKLFPLIAMVLLACWVNTTWAQTPHALDTMPAFQAYMNGKMWADSGRYDSAEKYYARATQQYEQLALGQIDSSLWLRFLEACVQWNVQLQHLGKNLSVIEHLHHALALTQPQIGSMNSQTANCYNTLGINYWYSGDYQKALDMLLKAVDIQLQLTGEVHKNIASYYTNLGILSDILGDSEASLLYYQKAIDIFQQLFGPAHPRLAAPYLNIGHLYRRIDEFEDALAYFKKAEAIRVKEVGMTHARMANIYGNLGVLYKDKGQLDKALEYQKKTIEIEINTYGENHNAVADTYTNMGILQRRMGNYEQAVNFCQKALDIYEAVGHQETGDMSAAYGALGIAYLDLGEYELAIQHLLKQKEIHDQALPPIHENIAIFWGNLGSVYAEKKNYPKALECYQKASSLLEQIPEQEADRAATYHNMGRMYKKLAQPNLALIYLEKAIALQRVKFANRHPDLASSYREQGQVYTQLGSQEEAQRSFQQAFQANTLGGLTFKGGYLPDIAQGIFSELEFLQALDKQADLFLQWKPFPRLNSADSTWQVAIQLIDQIRNSYRQEGTWVAFQEILGPIYRKAVENLLQLYQQSNEEAYLTRAFIYAEKNKSTLLAQAIKESGARQFGKIPIEVLEKERQLRIDLAFYEKKLYESMLSEKDSMRQISFRAKVFTLTQSYDSLITYMEQAFPDYYQLKYQTDILSVEEIQQGLAINEAILEYMIGDQALYVFLINKDHFQVEKIPLKSSLDSLVFDLRKAIFKPFVSGAIYAAENYNQLNSFASYSHALYQQIWAPMEKDLPEKVVVIPDGILGYIPFSMMVSQASTRSEHYRQHEYLIQQYEISYGYSSTLREMMKRKRSLKRRKEFIAFAPNFPAQDGIPVNSLASFRDALTPLKHNSEEVERIRALLGGKVLLDEAATESQFKALVSEYRVVHVASHARVNDQNPMYSKIMFSADPDSSEDGALYIAELFNLELPAEMVVFSACETGVGKLWEGEGIVSFARGASYAGAQSIITTLWRVNDASTSEIMQYFYKYLSQGKSKSEALRQAKLDYIAQSDQLSAHPFFWAAFVPVGDMEPVYDNEGWKRWILLGSMILLLGGIRWRYVRRRKNS